MSAVKDLSSARLQRSLRIYWGAGTQAERRPQQILTTSNVPGAGLSAILNSGRAQRDRKGWHRWARSVHVNTENLNGGVKAKFEPGPDKRRSQRAGQPRRGQRSRRQTLGSADTTLARAFQHRQGSHAARNDHGLRDPEEGS